MDCKSKGVVNTTYIIEGVESACNGFSTNIILSCSGNTSINLSTDELIFNGSIIPLIDNTFVIGSESNRFNNINTISGVSDYWVSNIGITTNNLIISGSGIYNGFAIGDNDNEIINWSSLTAYTTTSDKYVTGGTYDNNTAVITFVGANNFEPFSVDLSSIDVNDTFVTGGTISYDSNNLNGTLILNKNDGNSIIISGFTDVQTTGATLVNNIAYFDTNESLSAYTLDLSSFNTSDTFVTGYTYNPNSNTLSILQNEGVPPINVTINSMSGLTINGDFNVTGNTYLNTLSATTIDATMIYSGGTNLSSIISNIDSHVTGITWNPNQLLVNLNNNKPSVGVTIDTFSGLTVTNNLSVLGSGEFNGVQISGSTSGSTLLNILGTQGQLFSITDDLSGLLFSVNNALGNEILQVYDDNTVLIGDYNSPSLYTTNKITAYTGNNIVYEIDSNKYDSAFFDYVIKGASGVRSGNVYSAWSGSSVTWSEYSNVDIGDTSDVSLYLNENNGLIRFIVSANTSNWIIKTIIRSI
jgi:hypothetical protein